MVRRADFSNIYKGQGMEEQIFPGMAESALWSDEESDPMISSETLTKGMPSDPDVFAPGQSQWHLVGTWGLHAD